MHSARLAIFAIRQTASVGGNLAHADYRLDPPPPLLVLGAEVSLLVANGARTVPLNSFFMACMKLPWNQASFLIDVKIPFMPANSRAVYLRYSTLSANDWPCLGVAAFMTKASGRCRELRVALGGLASTPVLVGGLDFVNGSDARCRRDRTTARCVSTSKFRRLPICGARNGTNGGWRGCL